jgi:hypothetical protein
MEKLIIFVKSTFDFKSGRTFAIIRLNAHQLVKWLKEVMINSKILLVCEIRVKALPSRAAYLSAGAFFVAEMVFELCL